MIIVFRDLHWLKPRSISRRLSRASRRVPQSLVQAWQTLASVDCDFARCGVPPEMGEQQEDEHPEPLDRESTQRVHAVELTQVNLERREGNVLEGQPCH